ncbi:type VI secretion system contractile sheath small subunit [Sphingomonas sp.]|uniref:type VI secretion system contractile sheath small subunit n=1 Tax=Sphingomonas sp. TaxID=28214 RepID=UPI0035BC2694
MAQDGQKFIKRNRSPRVHIEYEVQTYGSVEKISLPFVMGVLADLSGKSEKEKKSMAERDFVNVDMDNFGDFQKSIAPRAAFYVDNTLTGEGKLAVDLTFNKMDDFTPGGVAKQLPATAKLLDARQQLTDLLAYMDGKDKAEGVIDQLLKNPDLLTSLAAESKARAGSDA